MHVLVVDDNATNRQILCKQLSSWGMRGTSVDGGSQALEALRSAAKEGTPHNLAILDMQMPGMDGIDLARRIKADPAIYSTRLVLLTSMGERGDGAKAREAGIEAYLTKPVRQSELYDTLATVVGTPETDEYHDAPFVTRHSIRERHSNHRVHLLVAEDNPVNQKVAVRMIERLGYGVDVVQDGLQALEALSKSSYAAVLMDVQMPNMDGYEATKEIRRRQGEVSDQRTPIIAMTANAMEGDREKAIEVGMDDYLSKPVRQEQLAEVLKRWISTERGQVEVDVSREVADGADDTEVARPTLDPKVLESLRELQQEGETDILAEIMHLFVEDAPSRIEQLRRAAEDGDAGSVGRISHSLRGSSGNMGARRMQELCEQLQAAGASNDLARVRTLIESLEKEYARARSALESEVAGR